MRVYTLSDMRSEKKLRVYTASEAKGLNEMKCLLPSLVESVKRYVDLMGLAYIQSQEATRNKHHITGYKQRT